jgi:hypothetical protein
MTDINITITIPDSQMPRVQAGLRVHCGKIIHEVNDLDPANPGSTSHNFTSCGIGTPAAETRTMRNSEADGYFCCAVWSAV